MATPTDPSLRTKCNTDKARTRCLGCQQHLGSIHFEEHLQKLNEKLNEIKDGQDSFRKTLRRKLIQLEEEKKTLIEKIEQWERDSIETLQQTAKELEDALNTQDEYFDSLENNLRDFRNEINSSQDQDVIVENNLGEWGKELAKLTEQLNKSTNITVQQSSTPLIDRIDLNSSSKLISFRFLVLAKIPCR